MTIKNWHLLVVIAVLITAFMLLFFINTKRTNKADTLKEENLELLGEINQLKKRMVDLKTDRVLLEVKVQDLECELESVRKEKAQSIYYYQVKLSKAMNTSADEVVSILEDHFNKEIHLIANDTNYSSLDSTSASKWYLTTIQNKSLSDELKLVKKENLILIDVNSSQKSTIDAQQKELDNLYELDGKHSERAVLLEDENAILRKKVKVSGNRLIVGGSIAGAIIIALIIL